MVEPLLYAALGFLTASLIALFMGRALWNRAVRLTTHRIMRRLPLSRDEIVASRDLLRAEQAIEHRRLERLANVMRQRMTQSMADVGRRDAANFALRTAIGEANAKTSAAETREATARKTMDEMKAEITSLKKQLANTQSSLAETQRNQKQLEGERAELIQLADTRRVEVATTRNELAQMKLTLDALQKQADAKAGEPAETQSLQSKLTTAGAELAQALNRLEVETQASAALRREMATLQRDLEVAQTEKAATSSPEEMTLLRQQIEWLAGDIARVAEGAQSDNGGSSNALHSAIRATRDTDPVSAAPLTFPPVS